jgi:hypothetical protein
MSQLHMVGEASNAVVISCRQYRSFNSFFSSTQEVAVLRMLHLFIHFMSQNTQSFLGCLSHASLKRPPWCGSLDHLVDAMNTISRGPLIDHHTYAPKV